MHAFFVIVPALSLLNMGVNGATIANTLTARRDGNAEGSGPYTLGMDHHEDRQIHTADFSEAHAEGGSSRDASYRRATEDAIHLPHAGPSGDLKSPLDTRELQPVVRFMRRQSSIADEATDVAPAAAALIKNATGVVDVSDDTEVAQPNDMLPDILGNIPRAVSVLPSPIEGVLNGTPLGSFDNNTRREDLPGSAQVGSGETEAMSTTEGALASALARRQDSTSNVMVGGVGSEANNVIKSAKSAIARRQDVTSGPGDNTADILPVSLPRMARGSVKRQDDTDAAVDSEGSTIDPDDSAGSDGTGDVPVAARMTKRQDSSDAADSTEDITGDPLDASAASDASTVSDADASIASRMIKRSIRRQDSTDAFDSTEDAASDSSDASADSGASTDSDTTADASLAARLVKRQDESDAADSTEDSSADSDATAESDSADSTEDSTTDSSDVTSTASDSAADVSIISRTMKRQIPIANVTIAVRTIKRQDSNDGVDSTEDVAGDSSDASAGSDTTADAFLTSRMIQRSVRRQDTTDNGESTEDSTVDSDASADASLAARMLKQIFGRQDEAGDSAADSSTDSNEASAESDASTVSENSRRQDDSETASSTADSDAGSVEPVTDNGASLVSRMIKGIFRRQDEAGAEDSSAASSGNAEDSTAASINGLD